MEALEDEAPPEERSEDEGEPDCNEAALIAQEEDLQDLAEAAKTLGEQGFGAVEGGDEGDGVAEAPAGEQPDSVEVAPAPPPPPPAPLAEAAAEGDALPRPRRYAKATSQVVGGRISFYESKGAFEAVCEHPLHGKCVATRTQKSNDMLANGWPKGGRPVGFLAAWLHKGSTCDTKEGHWAAFHSPEELRLQFRSEIAATLAGAALLACERPRVAGEPDEPPTLEGYM